MTEITKVSQNTIIKMFTIQQKVCASFVLYIANTLYVYTFSNEDFVNKIFKNLRSLVDLGMFFLPLFFADSEICPFAERRAGGGRPEGHGCGQ